MIGLLRRLPAWLTGLLLLLVLANAVLFAWGSGWLGGSPGSTQREPSRLAQQLQPERLKLLSGELAVAAKKPLECRELGSFNDLNALQAAESALQTLLQLPAARWQRVEKHQPGVYLLATQRAEDAAEVARKKARLDRAEIVPERSQALLGESEPSWIVKRFDSEAAAKALQLELREQKNLRLRVITQRLPVDQYWLRITGLTQAQSKTTHPAWPGGMRVCEASLQAQVSVPPERVASGALR